MEYSYKFRLYPTAAQQEQISRNFGCCRYVFNHFLAQRQEQYRETGKSPTRFQQDKSLTTLKQELSWLKEVDSTSLQATLQDLDAAFQNFFRRVRQGEKPGYPRFKSKRDHRQSYKSKCVGTNIKVLEKAVQLPKLGRVKCRISKEVKGRILSATISRSPSGKYFVALCSTDVEIEPLPSTGAAVGLDMGIKSFAVTSDASNIPTTSTCPNPRRSWPDSSGSSPEKQRGAGAGKRHGFKWQVSMSTSLTSAAICSTSCPRTWCGRMISSAWRT